MGKLRKDHDPPPPVADVDMTSIRILNVGAPKVVPEVLDQRRVIKVGGNIEKWPRTHPTAPMSREPKWNTLNFCSPGAVDREIAGTPSAEAKSRQNSTFVALVVRPLRS